MNGTYKPNTTFSAAAKSASSNTAPKIASSASARIDGRRAPRALELPLTQHKQFTQIQLLRQYGQRLLIHQIGTQAGQITFG